MPGGIPGLTRRTTPPRLIICHAALPLMILYNNADSSITHFKIKEERGLDKAGSGRSIFPQQENSGIPAGNYFQSLILL
jgi:hypothetical protein